MRCPSCQESVSSKVVDSRSVRDSRAIRRRRQCLACSFRYTTYEYLEQRQLQVLKRDGSSEEFVRAKLQAGLAKACAKRPVSSSQIETLVDEVEEALSRSAGVEVSSRELGEMVMEGLKPLDRVAYIRYASVYRNFQDLRAFQEMVNEMRNREQKEAQARVQSELPLSLGVDDEGDA